MTMIGFESARGFKYFRHLLLQDKSGFMRKSEFIPVTRSALEAFQRKYAPAAASGTRPMFVVINSNHSEHFS